MVISLAKLHPKIIIQAHIPCSSNSHPAPKAKRGSSLYLQLPWVSSVNEGSTGSKGHQHQEEWAAQTLTHLPLPVLLLFPPQAARSIDSLGFNHSPIPVKDLNKQVPSTVSHWGLNKLSSAEAPRTARLALCANSQNCQFCFVRCPPPGNHPAEANCLSLQLSVPPCPGHFSCTPLN